MIELSGKMIIISFFVMFNIVTFFMMNIDKSKAKKGKWRISERNIFICALFFGATGIFAGMYVFRHKTKHWYFKVFIPLFIIINLFLLYIIFLYLGIV
ncbi:UNVERIFIED_CONTAM: uncharacterized membrane protein YsdA (DUF1294 family) [Acetivibrio alkalicellulosi]